MSNVNTRPIMIVFIKDSDHADVFDIEGLTDQQIHEKLNLYLFRLLVWYIKSLSSVSTPLLNEHDHLSSEISEFEKSTQTAIEQFIATPSEPSLQCRRSVKDTNGVYHVVDLIIERGSELLSIPRSEIIRKARQGIESTNHKIKDCDKLVGKMFTVSLVDTHLSTDINHEDIQSVVHLNTTIGMSGLFLIRQHLAAMGVRFSDDDNSATNQQACLNQITNKVQGLNVSDSATNKDICTMIVDDKNIEHYFTLRLYASAA